MINMTEEATIAMAFTQVQSLLDQVQMQLIKGVVMD